jgi:hypothetical protein
MPQFFLLLRVQERLDSGEHIVLGRLTEKTMMDSISMVKSRRVVKHAR